MATYSISLDDVDVALLPVRMHRYNDFLKKEHFEFQVMKKDAVEELPTYTCHICDVEVPTAFASEHGASIKHRANANIASVAALRMRALATAPPIPPHPCTPSAGPTVHFCAYCSATVDEDHDKTKEHSVAVMHDRLLWDLMKAYVKDFDDAIDDSNKENQGLDNNTGNANAKTENQNGHAFDGRTYTTNNEIPDDKNGDRIVDDKVATDSATYQFIESTRQYVDSSWRFNKQKVLPVSSRGYIGHTKAKEILKEETTEQETTTTSMEDVARQLRHRHDKHSYIDLLYKLTGIEYSHLSIKESDGEIQINKRNEIIHVPVDNFHSYMYYKSGNAACIVCKTRFRADYADTHKYEMGHMNQVANIGDSHCIRKTQFGTNHCIICNRKLKNKNVAAHMNSRQHIRNKSFYTEMKTDSSNEEKLERVAANQKDNGNINVNESTGNENIAETPKDHAPHTKTNTNIIEDKPDEIANNNEGITNMNNNENRADENTVKTTNKNVEYTKTKSDATKEIKPDGISGNKEKGDMYLNENKAYEYHDHEETTQDQVVYTTKNIHTNQDEISDDNSLAGNKEENSNIDSKDNIVNKDVVKTPKDHIVNTKTNTHTSDEMAGNKEENIVETSGNRMRYTEIKTDKIKGYTLDIAGDNDENSNKDINHVADMTEQPKQPCSSKIPYPFKEESFSTVQCTICGCELSNTTKSMTAHATGRQHLRNEFKIEQAIVKEWVAGAKNSG